VNADLSPELQKELLDDFYAEGEEHLKRIREALVLLEDSIGKAQADSAIVEELFRNFHSFKGISAIVGLRAAEELAHASEDYLRELTKGRTTVSSAGLDLLMGAAQKLEQIIVAFRAQAPTPNIAGLLASFKTLTGSAPEAPAPARESLPTAVTAGPEAQADEATARGLVIWRCTFIPTRELDARGVNVNSVRARLSAVGEILRATPQVLGAGQIAFEFLVGMRETPANIAKWDADGISAELVESAASEAPAAAPTAAIEHEPDANPFIAPSHVVRVDLNRLDELMRITGELVIHRSRFDDQLAQASRSSAGLDPRSLQEVNTAWARSLRELREAIMRVRLVPVAEIFARMPFVVRDLARETKKQVRLRLEGQQTELDKYLVERLKDPLLHLVRNAFSHGVESPEERRAAHKPEEAAIFLRASAVGDSVLIQVGDNGRGIDPQAVARKAAAQGIPVPDNLDHSALLKILCATGFSTRDDADMAAGRGVGMAVVWDTVRELGGSISLETELGRGTQFTLRLPLTLAIAETFIVSAAGQTCAIPQTYVTEILHLASDQIRTVNRVELAPYRSGLLPVTRLTSLFHLPASARAQHCLLVLHSDRGSSGLIVDKVHGQKEVVVRAIRDPLGQTPGIMGATELGDGRPVLILDGAHLTSGVVRPDLAPVSDTPSFTVDHGN
jgi:two-component system chemotaxis sensor kinase CheA